MVKIFYILFTLNGYCDVSCCTVGLQAECKLDGPHTNEEETKGWGERHDCSVL